MSLITKSVFSNLGLSLSNSEAFGSSAKYANIMGSPMLASSKEVPRTIVENIKIFRIQNEFVAFQSKEELFRTLADKQNVRYSNDNEMIVFKTSNHKYYLKSRNATEFEEMKLSLRRLFEQSDETTLFKKQLIRIDHKNKKIHLVENDEVVKFNFSDIEYADYYGRDFSMVKMACCGWNDMCYRGRREEVELLVEMLQEAGASERPSQ